MRRAVLALLMSMAATAPAHAFDCAKARSVDEVTICADPQLKAADDAMAAAYASAKARLDAGEQKQLLASQRVWLQARRDECGEQADCILMRTGEREKQLDPQVQSGPGELQLVPFLRAGKGSPSQWQYQLAAFRLEPPFESATFDAFLMGLEAELPRAPIPAEDIIEGGGQYVQDRALTATYGSPRFLSVSLFTYEYAGGAHGNYDQTGHHFDLASDRQVGFDDIFTPDAAASIIPECTDLIRQAREERNAPHGGDAESWDYRQPVAEAVPDLSRWTFAADSAAVYFAPYEVGSYAEGEYECRMPLAFLEPLLRPGNPWVAD